MSDLKLETDVLNVEYAFRRLLKVDRMELDGQPDAGVFQVGLVKGIGKLLKKTAEDLKERINHISFPSTDSKAPNQKMQALGAIERLDEIGEYMIDNLKDNEHEDYHWLIVGHLVQVIANLLDQIEKNPPYM